MKKEDTRMMLEYVGRLGKHYREYHTHITPKQIADVCGVSLPTIYSFEKGECNNLFIFLNYIYYIFPISERVFILLNMVEYMNRRVKDGSLKTIDPKEIPYEDIKEFNEMMERESNEDK